MNRAGALLCGVLLTGCAPAAPVVIKEEAPMEWRGQFCEAGESKTRWVDNQTGWEMVWKIIGAPPPPVDLERFFAVAVFLGERNTGGYGIEFSEPVVDAAAQAATVRYKETAPSGFSIQALTRPYAVRLFPRPGPGRLKVTVEPAR